MGLSPEVLTAISGGGLTAGDYAGMTPEQIAMVAGQGQKDRSMQISMVENMRQSELAERKQTQEEMQQDRMFKLMQRQEARQEFQAMHSAMFDQMNYGLQKQKLALEKAQTQATLQNAGLEREKLDLQLNELRQQKATLDKMKDSYLEVPGYTDAEGKPLKMSIGELYAMGALDKVIDAGLKKTVYGGTGRSKVVELREYMVTTAKDMGASEHVQNMIKLMGPEMFKGMTRQKMLELRKNDTLFQLKSPEEREMEINRDLSMVDMLRVGVGAQLAQEQQESTDGADKPGGAVPRPLSLDDIMTEELTR